MSTPDAEHSNVIQFPPQLRVVGIEALPLAPPETDEEAVASVEYDGSMYDLARLLRPLSLGELRQIGGMMPRSNQEMWDDVVRRWPGLSAMIIADSRVRLNDRAPVLQQPASGTRPSLNQRAPETAP